MEKRHLLECTILLQLFKKMMYIPVWVRAKVPHVEHPLHPNDQPIREKAPQPLYHFFFNLGRVLTWLEFGSAINSTLARTKCSKELHRSYCTCWKNRRQMPCCPKMGQDDLKKPSGGFKWHWVSLFIKKDTVSWIPVAQEDAVYTVQLELNSRWPAEPATQM